MDFTVSYTLELGGRTKTSEAETIAAKLVRRHFPMLFLTYKQRAFATIGIMVTSLA